MPYISSTKNQQTEMLNELGLISKDELFSEIDEKLKIKNLDLPEGVSELSLSCNIRKIAAKNRVFSSIFRGAGAYLHYIPAIVKSVTSKEEFVTAYTPYQAELSQGVLQSIFEYQTMICALTGMDASNASVYDGATAAAEAVAMIKDRRRNTIIVAENVNPETLAVIKTYCTASETIVKILPHKNGKVDISALNSLLDGSIAGIYLQQPNFFGIIENVSEISEIIHKNGGKVILGCEPISTAILPSPAEQGADIAVGEGQPLGMPLSFGGPYLGFMACTQELVRKLPGRIVGETVDKNGERAFVLTLQAREQHIRREKASSNICSNQAHCALTAAVYLAAVGPLGLKKVANQCVSKAHYLAERLCEIQGFKLKWDGEFFNEFVTTSEANASDILKKLEENGILGGLEIDKNEILWCATEMNTKDEIDNLVSIIKGVS